MFGLFGGSRQESTSEGLSFEEFMRQCEREYDEIYNVNDDDHNYDDLEIEPIDNESIEYEEEVTQTNSHRPTRFEDFVGQEHIKETLGFLVKSARARGTALNHILFYGQAGLGKTTLAGIIASQLGGELHAVNAGAIASQDDIIDILAKLDGEGRDVFFIDEIHRLDIKCQEILYEAMEDFKVTVQAKISNGGNETTVQQVSIPRFTLIGATTLQGDISKPMLDRFVLQLELQPYSIDELSHMAVTKGFSMGIKIDADGAIEIAKRAKGVARYVTNYLQIARDVAYGLGKDTIDKETTQKAFKLLQVDKIGLERKHYRYLESLDPEQPVGITTVALNMGESKNTVERLIEPPLVSRNFIKKTPRGRILTERGYEYLANKENNF